MDLVRSKGLSDRKHTHTPPTISVRITRSVSKVTQQNNIPRIETQAHNSGYLYNIIPLMQETGKNIFPLPVA